jgi:hypothetical protein
MQLCANGLCEMVVDVDGMSVRITSTFLKSRSDSGSMRQDRPGDHHFTNFKKPVFPRVQWHPLGSNQYRQEVRTNEFSRLDEAFDRLLTLRKPLVLLDDDGLDITYFNYDPSQGKFRTPQDRQTHVNEFRVRRQPSYCTIP